VGTIKGFVLSVPKPTFNAIAAFFWIRNAKYFREANAFADVLGERRALLQAAQVMYELVHLVDKNSFKVGTVGCTTSVRYEPTLASTRMLRTLDWSLPGMKDATRVYRFIGKDFSYLAVGTVGATSTFTALHEQGRFAAVLNDAPPMRGLKAGLAPSFAIRRVMEECADLPEAYEYLRSRRWATSALYTLCDLRDIVRVEHDGRAEFGTWHAPSSGKQLITTNHYIQLHTEEVLARDQESLERFDTAERAVKLSHAQWRAAYKSAPINMSYTQYRAEITPGAGAISLF